MADVWILDSDSILHTQVLQYLLCEPQNFSPFIQFFRTQILHAATPICDFVVVLYSIVCLLFAATTGAIVQVPFFATMKVLGMLRVPPEEEHEGLDISHHGGSAYPREFSRLGGDLSLHGGSGQVVR